MTCPACQATLGAGQERCPACGTMVAPAVEGALAPDTSRLTPPGRGKPAPIRDIPALRKRDKGEKTWKDEVRERVQKRKRTPKAEPGEPELPIFGELEPPATPPVEEPEVSEADVFPDLELRAPDPPLATGPLPEPEPQAEDEPELSLRPSGPIKLDIPEPEAYDPLSEEPEPVEEVEEREAARRREDDWGMDDAPEPSDRQPVERPAQFAERLEAGAVDAAVLSGLAAVVIYFASRAAHVPVEGLWPVWPWLGGYLALLGLAYASYFTGTTGQTPGKMLLGLRVVEASGGPPSYPRALVRAAAGAMGSLLAGAFAVPIFFDPARRALHDRLFRTRVVKY